ncbi:hypothetical protein CRENBAI_023852 [Crenichthys baileyi]|uniref:Uncharacterized protein n=1 Tax=Crenichthys baileyi TaxID=28760 RepID=A0AAV9RPY1_9TELE
MSELRDCNDLTSEKSEMVRSICTLKSEFPSSESEISTGTLPKVGIMSWKVGATRPYPTSAFKMAATCISSKLTQLNVPASTCQWINSFLMDRQQQTVGDGWTFGKTPPPYTPLTILNNPGRLWITSGFLGTPIL